MSLENLVTEVRTKAAREVAEVRGRTAAERKTLEDQRDREIARIRSEQIQTSEREIQREVTRVMAAATLQSKKILTDATEKRIESGYALLRERISAYTRTPDYEALLARMAELGVSVIGEDARFVVRAEDAGRLPTYLQIRVLSDSHAKALGGLVAQTPDGRRRLDLTFDEILRWKEDSVREILSRK